MICPNCDFSIATTFQRPIDLDVNKYTIQILAGNTLEKKILI